MRDVAERVASSIVALAFYIVYCFEQCSSQMKTPRCAERTFSVDHVANFRFKSRAQFEILVRRIQSGRILVGDEIIANADDRAPLAPRHDIKTAQFRTGTSGPPIPDNDPYQVAGTTANGSDHI